MTQLEALKSVRNIIADELYEISANYLMTKPKTGHEDRHTEYRSMLDALEVAIQKTEVLKRDAHRKTPRCIHVRL